MRMIHKYTQTLVCVYIQINTHTHTLHIGSLYICAPATMHSASQHSKFRNLITVL